MTLLAAVDTASATLALLWFLGLSVAVAVSDVRWRRIPNRIIFPAILGLPGLLALPCTVALLASSASSAEPRLWVLLSALAGSAVLCSVNLLLAVLGGMGGGDAKLSAVLGLLLGYFGGWAALLLGTMLAWAAAGMWIWGRAVGRYLRRLRHTWHARRGSSVRDSRAPPAVPTTAPPNPPHTLPFAPFLVGGAWLALILAGVSQILTSHSGV